MATLAERITVDPEQCGGRPCVRGMRIRVSDVLDLLANGLSPEQIVEELPGPGTGRRGGVPALRKPASGRPGAGRVTIWLDAQLPPSAAAWITATFGIEAHARRATSDCAMRRTRRSFRRLGPRMRW